MENHEKLFKAHIAVLSPRNQGEINRERHRLARVKKRVDCFQQNRQISLSPTPVKKLPSPTAIRTAEQENHRPVSPSAASEAMIMTKSERQKIYLEKFYAWKAASKKPATKDKETVNKPLPDVASDRFVPSKRRSIYLLVDSKAVKSSADAVVTNKNYRTTDKPLAICAAAAASAIGNHAVKKVKNASSIVDTNSVKPTVKSNNSDAKTALKPKSFEMTKANGLVSAAAVKHKPAGNIKSVTTTAATVKVKPAATAAGAARIKPVASVKLTNPATAASRKPANESATKHKTAAVIRNVKPKPAVTAPGPSTSHPKPIAEKAKADLVRKPWQTSERGCIIRKSVGPVVSKPANLMTQPFEKPTVANNIAKPIRGGGAAAKFKPTGAQKSVKSSATTQLSKRMKAKKPADNKQKMANRVPNLKELVIEGAVSPITPLDVESADHPFQTQVTSTQNKPGNSSANLFVESCLNISNISPLSASDNRDPVEVVAKRQLLPIEAEAPKVQRKYNFSRYSEANSLIESPTKDESTVVPKLKDVTGNDDEMTLLPQTPPQNADSVPNYLSPFVSVARGKVNSRSEREKRDSMYLQEQNAEQPETPALVRRTMATVNYFRLQLSKEIARLNLLCDTWETYTAQNIEELERTGGKDMIDGAIGQTRLLTNKKLMQFKSLIDRCEAGVTGKGLLPNDGSEATKPVLAADLEGWWDMISLQSENVDKRFSNLERWKANGWTEPDVQEPPKPKVKQLIKTKPASKASSNIRSFLRKALAEKRKNEHAQPISDDLVPLNETPKRRSRVIVVRDRKSFSPAKTVLRLSSGSGSRPSVANNLLKSAIKGAAEQKIRQQQNTPPAVMPRMSILKTPGTAKRESVARGVVFSVKKKVRRFQFTREEDHLSDDENAGHDNLEDCEEDMSLERSASSSGVQETRETTATDEDGNTSRIYALRNRRVKLRPSSEFM